MVRRGEYLERAVVVPGATHPIEGLFHRGGRRPALLVLPPRPTAGAMESPVIAELAWAVTRAGHPTLRFNWPGVGASGGAFTPESAQEAARLAAEHLELSSGSSILALVGLGYGAELAVHLAVERRRAGKETPLVALVAPEPGLDVGGLAEVGAEVLVAGAGGDDARRREVLRTLASSIRGGRLVVIPDADPTFVRGLVDLGRAVAEALAPPGLIDLA